MADGGLGVGHGEGVRMKPARIVYESHFEREVRRERERRSDGLLEAVEKRAHARWETAQRMLGWYFANRTRHYDVPAMDASKDIIQGLRKDMEEHLLWVNRVTALLGTLELQQGDARGLQLLWGHYRAPVPVGFRQHEGRRVVQYGQYAMAIRELHTEFGGSRDGTIREYWRAFELVEGWAYHRKWVAALLERPKRGANEVRVYQRNRDEEG